MIRAIVQRSPKKIQKTFPARNEQFQEMNDHFFYLMGLQYPIYPTALLKKHLGLSTLIHLPLWAACSDLHLPSLVPPAVTGFYIPFHASPTPSHLIISVHLHLTSDKKQMPFHTLFSLVTIQITSVGVCWQLWATSSILWGTILRERSTSH